MRDPAPICNLSQCFASLEDPRIERHKRHQLIDILTIAVCAIISGADNWVEIEEFGSAKIEWLRGFLELPNGIPSHDTFGNVFARLCPKQFKECFLTWVRSVFEVTQGQVIAIDGKRLRRSHDQGRGKAAIHMVSAWACANRLVLGQVKTNEKSNKITGKRSEGLTPWEFAGSGIVRFLAGHFSPSLLQHAGSGDEMADDAPKTNTDCESFPDGRWPFPFPREVWNGLPAVVQALDSGSNP